MRNNGKGIKGIKMKKKAYIFDIDNTLADCEHRLIYIDGSLGPKDWDVFYSLCHKDKPIEDVCDLYRQLYSLDAEMLIVTGRPDKILQNTVSWLHNNDIYFSPWNLFMRKDGDHRPDYEVKREIYEREIKDKYQILGVFEDRQQCVDMWRSLGLTCFQVAKGNY